MLARIIRLPNLQNLESEQRPSSLRDTEERLVELEMMDPQRAEAVVSKGRDAFPALVQRGWPEWAIALLFVLLKMENQMSDINQAESDLAAAVESIVTELGNLQSQIANSGASNQADLQAAADSIEQQVAVLQGAVSGGGTTATPPATGV